jgi:hypothetical protein
MSAEISPAAQASFELLVQHALCRALAPEGQKASAQVLAALPDKMVEGEAVVLTVASYQFRIIVAIYHRLDEATKAHFAALNGQDPEGYPDDAFLDALRECGNIACGAINRDLGVHFPHVGMSTPNILSRGALAYAPDLGRSLTRHMCITGLSLDFYASLYVAADARLDFRAEVPADDEAADTGEMEMF